jgi:DNA invertase Pin-like site-specific DNA recombinase
MFALVGVLAEVERSWIIERTHAGLRRARAQGKRLGRPRVIGDPIKLRRLLANGTSYRAAARLLGVSPGAVRRAAQLNRIAHPASP